MQAERQQGHAGVLPPRCGTEADPGPAIGVWRRRRSCWLQGHARVERKAHCWQHSTGGEGGDREHGDRGRHVLSLWESATEEEARFLREPFSLTAPPLELWLGLCVFPTPCGLCCFCCPGRSRAGQSPVGVAVRGSGQSLVLPLVRWWCPPLLWARGAPRASLSAMALTHQAWRRRSHSSEKQEEEREREKLRMHLFQIFNNTSF